MKSQEGLGSGTQLGVLAFDRIRNSSSSVTGKAESMSTGVEWLAYLVEERRTPSVLKTTIYHFSPFCGLTGSSASPGIG